jgi:hypothetical protein
MILSLNEIETTILKAARGAGMEWGLAEEAAQAGRWLARRRLPFAEPLLAVLEVEAFGADPVFDGLCLRPRSGTAWLCPIRAGACLSDLGERVPLRIERVLQPLLLLPFAARRADPVALSWDGVSVLLGVASFAATPAHSASLRLPWATVELTASLAAPPESSGLPPEGGVSVDPVVWSRLQDFEARTYVPASRQSRLSGAGATRSDND